MLPRLHYRLIVDIWFDSFIQMPSVIRNGQEKKIGTAWVPLHSTRIYSNLSNDKEYDQIMFFPGHTKQDFTGNMGIFDFDGALFPDLWQTRTEKQFRSFLRYYISDHRILWAEFKI